MAADWIVVTLDDVKAQLVAGQANALNASALEALQDERFDATYPRVAARVRGKVMKHCVLSATPNSVPPELHLTTIFLLIAAIQPGLQIPLTEDQQQQIETAEKDLERVADGKDTVSAPSDPLQPSPAQTGGYVKVVRANPRYATREKMLGI